MPANDTQVTPVPHLWEVSHPYYCNLGNYYAPGGAKGYREYKSLADFLVEEGDSDMDYNLVFRWDWVEDHDEDSDGAPFPHMGDDNYRNGKLFLFIMQQRRGLYEWIEIEVCRADEPAVIAYLTPRWEHMKALWEPLGAGPARTSPRN
jgi:hypothetical protein